MKSKTTWSPLIRGLHWLVALPVLINFFSEGGEKPHKYLGYLALAAVVLRLLKGFFSTDAAGFSSFPFSGAKEHLQGLIKFQPPKYEGHNPLASWAYIMMWALIIALGVTGYMMGTDAFWGEEWLEEFHEGLAVALEVLVIVHFTGIIADSILHKRKTWLAMISGKKD